MENIEEAELEIDIDDIGTILKSSRLKSKKSLEEISSELCIRKIYLVALEESDYDTLPPIPYGVGYVRTYAKYLGLSPERAVKLYKAAAVEKEPEEEPEEVVEPEINKINKWHIIAGVAALALVCGIWNATGSKSSSKEEQATNVIENATTSVKATKEAQDEKVKPEILEEDEKSTAKEGKEKKEVENKKETAAEKNKTSEKAKEISKDKVTVVFTGDCWAKLQDKKKVYLERVYHKGDVREVPYTENLFLSVGVPANVKVYIKGVEKNILKTNKKMNIPLDSLN